MGVSGENEMTVSATTVTQYYTGIFRQAPSAAVSSAYQAMANDAAALNSMLSAANLQVDPVVRLYQTAFNRLPDPAGMTAWVVPYSTGAISLQFIANGFTQSTEFTTLYPTSLSNAQFVGALYWNILQRAGEDAGIAGWVNALNSGALTRAQVLLGFSESGEFKGNIESNVNAFLTNIANTPVANQGQASLYAGNLFEVSGSSAPTYALTTGADNVDEPGNILVTGLGDGAAGVVTLQAIDTIKGNGSSDTMRITYTGANTEATNAALISGIENFEIRNTEVSGKGTVELNAANVAGLTRAASYLSTGDIEVTNLASGSKVAIVGNGTVVSGAVNMGYAAAAGTVGAVGTLDLTGGVKNTNTAVVLTQTGGAGNVDTFVVNSVGASANAIKSLELEGGGAAAVTSLTVNASAAVDLGGITKFAGTAAKITVAGAANNVAATASAAETGAVVLGTIENTTVKTIDASGLTAGGIQAVLNTNAALAVKGGAGNDIITTGAVLTTGSVDAGSGSADILNIAAGGTHVATAALGAKYTNFEILSLNDSQNVSFVSGITALHLNAMTSKTIAQITAAQAGAITVKGNQTTAIALDLADATGSSDVVSLALKSDVATTNVDVAGLSIAGVETLNIAASTGTAGTSSDVSFGVGGATTLTAINISGTADVGLVGTNTAKAVTLVSTTTGVATISGNFKNASSITTGAGKDVITLGTGFATYNSGAADDTFNGTVAQLNTGADYNTINGGDGTNTLNITDGAAATVTIVDNNLKNVSNIKKISITDTTTGDQTITTGGWFDAAFKASGVELTTAATEGDIVIDMTTFSGAAKITATTVGAGAGEGALNIQTGSGADTVTVSAAAAGDAGVVKTYDGNDTIITASTAAFTLTAGKGNDTVTLASTGIETVVFEATAANNGTDTITGFEWGAGKDVLNVAGFVAAARADSVGATIASGIDATALNVVGLTDIQTLTSANFGAAASNTVIKTAASSKLFVVADLAADVDSVQNLYYVSTDASNVATVTLVGTVNEGTLNADNFTTV